MSDKIDFGKINCPESWNDVKLSQFQKINEYYSDKERTFNVIDVIDIFIEKDKDYIMSLPTEFLNIIMEKLKFLEEEPKVGEPTNSIEIDGEKYFINFANKLKTGEYIAVEMAMKGNKNDFANILAILCRKQDEIFDSKFENEILPDRIELFNKQPITKILPLISFFMNCYILLVTPSQLSLKVKEAINQERENIQNSYKNGECSRRTMKSVMKTLKKYEKIINGI